MLADHGGWVAFGLIAVVLLLAFLVTTISAGPAMWSPRSSRRYARHRPPRGHFRPDSETQSDAPRNVAAIVVNPTKFADVSAVRRRATRVCLDAGWAEPLWIETTEQDPGRGQARQAVDEGVQLVCVLGGDGTVRAVASALTGSETPMGLLPGGTGNLLARNLGLPVDNVDNALRLALVGRNKRIDVGRLLVEDNGDKDEHVFMVMAGVGFDAAIMADAPERLKKHIGWAAYSVSGLRNLRGAQFKVKVVVDTEPPMTRRVRTVVIGNCGKLQGGLVLLPEAEVDDGWLDAVLLSPKGLVGWVAVATRIVTRQRKGHERVDHRRARSISIEADRGEPVQLDGDTIGNAERLTATVDPLALLVRVG